MKCSILGPGSPIMLFIVKVTILLKILTTKKDRVTIFGAHFKEKGIKKKIYR